MSVLAALQVGRISPTFELLSESLGVGFVEFGWLVSLITLASALFGVVAGLLVVAVGLHQSLSIGALSLAILTLLTAVAPNLWLVLFLRALEGLAYLAVVVAAPTVIAATTAPEKRAKALAYWGTFFIVGLSAASTLGGWVAEQTGWRVWFAFCGALTAVAAMVATRFLPAIRSGEVGEIRFVETLRSLPKSLWALALAFLITTVLSVAIVSMLPLFLSSQFGISIARAGVLAGVIALSSLMGNLFYGKLSSSVTDRTLFLCSTFCAAMGAILGFSSVNWIASMFGCIIVLFFVGILVAMCFAVVPRLTDGSTGQVGAANGLLTQFGGLGALLGPPAIGTIAETLGWSSLALLLAVLCAIELFLLRAALMDKAS
ncbi:MFS transporter [Tateyamaria omphalii]|uniref:MFS transporter n=1 Tax=Tateyamaria omphalii TaxID=299262 RepID=UPI0016718CEC|nr:MFS transporter [Tateyamaria omphalii]GGX71053.1 MFS transporter [Tateyamaria omphalii]